VKTGGTEVEDFLTAHRGDPVTAVQVVNGTGVPLNLVTAVLNAAWEQGWVTRLPDGKWELS
jgi:predicted Rossmann fold nucleotide-binding protein DprA/Smf involved in DNA uptake